MLENYAKQKDWSHMRLLHSHPLSDALSSPYFRFAPTTFALLLLLLLWSFDFRNAMLKHPMEPFRELQYSHLSVILVHL